jgi:polygalacturonase
VVFKNNTMKDVETPLVFTSYYEYRPLDLASAEKQLQPGGFILGNQIWPGPTDPAQPFVRDKTPDMSGIVVDGLTATGADLAGIIVGLPEKAIGITLKNIKIQAKRGLLVRNAEVVTQGVAIASRAPTRRRCGRKRAERSPL